MGQLSVTNMTLQMADISLKNSMGILEDVPVRVGKYFISAEFVVMDVAKDDSRVPIILGRSFLHTTGVVIDVRDDSLTLRIRDDTITFILDKALKHPELEASCHMININDYNIDECSAFTTKIRRNSDGKSDGFFLPSDNLGN
ncbi:uncharacterized protein LOC141602265 [Silene latifolia]|uniref:uncharacterized protein LOC141602265 n=1 Tax=Silene latifolia TaxID=37657 RepID=UPI003D773F4A